MPEPGTAALVAEVRGFAAPGGTLGLTARVGDVIVLAGPNGSGKTSLLRLLAGLTSPLGAQAVAVIGRDPAFMPATMLSEAVHFAQQDPRDGLVGLTVAGEFRLRRHPLPPDAATLQDCAVATLSSGEARRVALAVAEVGSPRLLLLDEPTEGLDVERRARLAQIVRRASHGGAVIVADHSGFLDGMATQRLEFHAEVAAPIPAMPKIAGNVVIACPEHIVRRDSISMAMPSLSLGPGLHALIGPNGSGKSTLLLSLAGLLERPTGAARISCRPAQPGANVRLLLPRARELFCRDKVAAELAGGDGWVRATLVPESLDSRHPLTLSGGQAQRVALAKVLGWHAPVYLLDEPEAHLDHAGRAALVAILVKRIQQGACIIVATHDAAIQAAANTRTFLGGAA